MFGVSLFRLMADLASADIGICRTAAKTSQAMILLICVGILSRLKLQPDGPVRDVGARASSTGLKLGGETGQIEA